MDLSLGWVTAIVVLVAGIVAKVAETWATRKTAARFDRERDELQAEHAKQLENLRAQNSAELEITKAQLAEQLGGRKQREQNVIALQNEHFPELVKYLRKIKRELANLKDATSGKSEQTQPIDLGDGGEDAILVRESLDDIKGWVGLFEDTLDQVRLVTARSDYTLPARVSQWLKRWAQGETPFRITDDEMAGFREAYGDDLSFLSGEFYKMDDEPVGAGARLQIKRFGEELGGG